MMEKINVRFWLPLITLNKCCLAVGDGESDFAADQTVWSPQNLEAHPPANN